MNQRRWTLKRYNGTEVRDALLFLLPAIAIITIFVAWPGAKLFYFSLTDLKLMGQGKFVGLNNFTKILGSSSFLGSVSATLQFMVVVVILQTALALGSAIILNHETQGIRTIRSILFVPVVLSFVVVGYIWRGMYNADYGLVNGLLSSLGLPKQGFLDDGSQALGSLIFACIWKTWPFFMMIFIAGLKDIPISIHESALIDGAGPFRRFVSLTLPMLKRTLLFVVVITTMDSVVKVFVPVYVMTSGGPMGSTDMLVHRTWRTAFRLGKFGEASAMAVLLFLFVLLINLIQLKVGERSDD